MLEDYRNHEIEANAHSTHHTSKLIDDRIIKRETLQEILDSEFYQDLESGNNLGAPRLFGKFLNRIR